MSGQAPEGGEKSPTSAGKPSAIAWGSCALTLASGVLKRNPAITGSQVQPAGELPFRNVDEQKIRHDRGNQKRHVAGEAAS